ncbi:MAG: hypothetical protein AAGB29_05920 [Planctomycetota bacterium]
MFGWLRGLKPGSQANLMDSLVQRLPELTNAYEIDISQRWSQSGANSFAIHWHRMPDETSELLSTADANFMLIPYTARIEKSDGVVVEAKLAAVAFHWLKQSHPWPRGWHLMLVVGGSGQGSHESEARSLLAETAGHFKQKG